jgi:hypothetical protein
MRKLMTPLITLPLLAMPFFAMKPATAASFTPLAAIELLAKSKAADAKCHHLASEEAQELSDYLARAEIAAATQTSVAETQGAIAAGRSSGAASLCGPQTLADVRATLNAAREAMAAIGNDNDEPQAEEPARQQVAAAAPEEPPKQKSDPKPRFKAAEETPVKAPKGKGLTTYAAAAVGYYVDRRCRHLSAKEARRYYAGILKSHQSAVAASGKKAVGAMLRNAESEAGQVACGSRSAALVKGGYARAVN